MRKIVIVLGAGASWFLGYPLGKDLRESITMPKRDPDFLRSLTKYCSIEEHQFRELSRAFNVSMVDSIDAFLSNRPEFTEVGKAAIAYQILKAEKSDHSIGAYNHPEDKWIQLFTNKIARTKWDELDFSWISFITFNYDRSLEYLLLYSMSMIFGKSHEEVIQKLSTLKIIHVYGCVSKNPYDFSNSSTHDFRYGYYRDLSCAVNNIRVIPEDRETTTEIEQARDLLFNADKIAFLGFSFDEINLKRLNSINTCRASINLNGLSSRDRNIYGTCFKMESGERARAVAMTANSFQGESFADITCTTLVRRFSIFHD